MTSYRHHDVYPPHPRDFFDEARHQRVCGVCGIGGAFEAHHVVPKQRLKRDGHYELLYDGRNAMRLCMSCHSLFEQRILTIETRLLPDLSICFLWQTLGVAGRNFLERVHTGVDRRYTLHEDESCPTCQPNQP